MLRVALIQSDILWENIPGNLEYLSFKIEKIKQQADLILLPELFSTGFTMNTAELAESMDGKTVRWMRSQARLTHAVLGGSVIIEDQGNYVNRFLWISPDGKCEYYDKRHLFRMGEEDRHFTGGNAITVVELKGWRIRLNICYDLRFPVWSRNAGDYDLLVYIANWPESRNKVWLTLLQARAIENQCYVVGLNRIGKDGNGITYSGDSLVVNFKGDPVESLPACTEASLLAQIDLAALRHFREKFPAYLDADPFKLL
jgi:omega-amidase